MIWLKLSWLKQLTWTRMLSWAVAFLIASSLLFPLFPVSQTNPFTQWLTPVAHAQVNLFRELLERTGLYSPPRSNKTPPTGRRAGGAGRGPICALPKEEQNNRYQEAKHFSKDVKALMPLEQIGEQTPAKAGTALQPNIQEAVLTANPAPNTGFVGGLTIDVHPTFWFYVPYISAPETPQNRVAQFVLLDETERPVWNELMSVELLENPRLVEYSLPYTLETDKLYTWYFSVICDSDKLSRNPVVRGWVQQVEPTEKLQTALQNAPRFEQYIAYAENGVWFETVNSLVKIRRQFPSVNRDAWTNLLDYFGVPDNQLYLKSAEPSAREVVNGSQLPVRM